MYLTTATLAVVPDNLQQQWANEILKHCTDLLRVLNVGAKDELPDAPALALDYDVSSDYFFGFAFGSTHQVLLQVVLMSHSTMCSRKSLGALNTGHH